MVSLFPRSNDCPSGRLWYTCAANKFQGCCSVDPCSLASCPDELSAGNSSEAPAKSSASTLLSAAHPVTTGIDPTVGVATVPTVGTIASTSVSAATTTSATIASAQSASPQNTRFPTDATVAAGVGGMMLVVLAIGAAVWHIRKKKARPDSTTEGDTTRATESDTTKAVKSGVDTGHGKHDTACIPASELVAELDGSEPLVISVITPVDSTNKIGWGSARWLTSAPLAVQRGEASVIAT
ncbi:hypothetical protein JX265_009492 [Neoarthrinium moseri]|uniref:Uncharacterized protein n=1 Tax=Neoarthrinium moseri TaxID=1658444 RepID=A0A9Q0AL58_9PEZI|nr:hypothetical protein JX265_009492 [Neoarthrinium moseri]